MIDDILLLATTNKGFYQLNYLFLCCGNNNNNRSTVVLITLMMINYGMKHLKSQWISQHIEQITMRWEGRMKDSLSSKIDGPLWGSMSRNKKWNSITSCLDKPYTNPTKNLLLSIICLLRTPPSWLTPSQSMQAQPILTLITTLLEHLLSLRIFFGPIFFVSAGELGIVDSVLV